jgi:hypothetical protein
VNKQTLTIDAKQMISALLGGRAREVLYSDYFQFFTTERKTWEVKRYIPLISTKSGVPQEKVFPSLRNVSNRGLSRCFF